MRTLAITLLISCLAASFVAADEYSITAIDEPAPADEFSAEIGEQLSPTGFVVKRGEKTMLCTIWLCKAWPVKDDFKPTQDLLYPFEPGQLIGVVQYARRGGDFRDQKISRGAYTLRYAHQPVDGNHVGTSPTRDFLLLLSATEDQSPATLDIKKLHTQSAKAAESSHPCLLLMLRLEGEITDKPQVSVSEEPERVAIRLPGKAIAGERQSLQAIEVVVVGHADE